MKRPALGSGRVVEEIDYWALEYDSVSDQLECPICQTAFVSPVTLKCGHTFCRSCIEAARDTLAGPDGVFTCPIDRKAVSGEFEPSPYLISGLVNDLVVLCPFSSRGCTFRDKRWLLDSHIAQHCGYVKVTCTEPCDKFVQRRHYVEGECNHKVAECPNDCGVTLAQADVESHLEDSCPKGVVRCRHCDAEVLRNALEGHEDQCDLADIACAGAPLGCKWGGKRGEVAAEQSFHEEICALAAMTPVVAAQARRIDSLESQNQALRSRVELLNRQLRDVSQPDVHVIIEYERVRKELDHMLASEEGNVKQLMMLTRENVKMTEDIAFLRNTVSTLGHQVHMLTMGQRRLLSQTWLPDRHHDLKL